MDNNGTIHQSNKNLAVIVAGGKGVRMQSSRKKQYMALDGIPVLVRTLMAFDRHPRVDEIILVVPETDLSYCRDTLVMPAGLTTSLHLVPGGITRQDSVCAGLATAESLCVDNESTLVLVHDGVRPFVSQSLVDNSLNKAKESGACIPALEISDTVKEIRADQRISRTLDRSVIFRAQTPQAFRLDLILTAFSHAAKTGFSGTDEASILEHAGIPVYTVAGDPLNIKLTTPHDLTLAEFFLKKENHFS